MTSGFNPGQRVIITADGDEYDGTIAEPEPGVKHEWYQLRIVVDGEVLIVDKKKVRHA